jgi:hypothetical protein
MWIRRDTDETFKHDASPLPSSRLDLAAEQA